MGVARCSSPKVGIGPDCIVAECTEIPAKYRPENRYPSMVLFCPSDTVLTTSGAIMQKRAAIYVRVSTDKQTIDNQVAALRQIAERRGWELVEVKLNVVAPHAPPTTDIINAKPNDINKIDQEDTCLTSSDPDHEPKSS